MTRSHEVGGAERSEVERAEAADRSARRRALAGGARSRIGSGSTRALLARREREALDLAIPRIGAVSSMLVDLAGELDGIADELWELEDCLDAACAMETLADRIAAESRRYGELIRLLERRRAGSVSWELLEEIGLPAPGRRRPGAPVSAD